MAISIHAAAAEIRAGKLTPEALLDQVLQRIDQLDKQVHAWVLVDREGARRQARRAGEELAAGRDRGPLHGIPLGVKDIFDVRDWPTAAGYQPWQNSVARQDATVVERLRNAGAIFLGKTVTTQFASFDPPVTVNPWRHNRTPGGSSSGSAAAMACGMCLGALGSQTGGSITRPAAYCGVAGFKPTFGTLSCAGVIPLAPSLDHPGVMAGCVRDLALLVEAMSGPDPLDSLTAQQPWPAAFQAARGGSLKPTRILRLGSFFQEKADDETSKALAALCKRLADAGVAVVDTPLPPRFAETTARHRALMAVECAAIHEARVQADPESYGRCIRSLMEEGARYSAIELSRTFEHKRAIIADMEHLAGDDVLLTPSARSGAPGAETTGDPLFNSPWSYLGFPTVSVPYAWTNDGLPLAIQLAARRGADAKLLEVAAWCEQAVQFERREV
jgi:aspartyl-tRNA(Asn)/glutamyl-tRNA(Gln) amidotransferase subunit A